MVDNQELTSKELCSCPLPDWMGSYDGLMCGKCGKICSADARAIARAIKEAELKEATYPKNCCREYAEHLETTYIGYSLHEKLLNEAKQQLTTTQQALDSSCQTNQVLVKRLQEAAGALKEISRNSCHRGDVWLPRYSNEEMQTIAKAALASIKE